MVETQTVKEEHNCGGLGDIQRPCLTQQAIPFLCAKIMPDCKGHALSLYKDYA